MLDAGGESRLACRQECRIPAKILAPLLSPSDDSFWQRV